ncbi:MAG: beta-ketoacyl-ACP synthase III [Thermoleophilia bacterium]
MARALDAPRVGITGIGTCVPDRVLTNAELARFVETDDEWIAERTGIRERRISDPGVGASDLSVPAARDALAQAGVDPHELDLVIVATITPDMPFPATASVVAESLGAHEVAAYDMQAGCTGFVYGVSQAYGAIASGLARRVLVVGVDLLTKYVDWHDRGTCILFGDGAGAAVVEPVAEGGFLAFQLGNDGSHVDDLLVPAGGSRSRGTPLEQDRRKYAMEMNGREVFKFATRVMVTSAEQVLAQAGMGVDDVDVYVPHQANKRIIDHAVKTLGVPTEKVFVNVDRYGNTSAASIPLCLGEGTRNGTIRPGQTVLMTGVGTGLTWGSALITWSEPGSGLDREDGGGEPA